MRKNNNNNGNTSSINSRRYAICSDFGFHFRASCVIDIRCGAFLFATCWSEPLGVPPWTDFDVPWGTCGPILPMCWKIRILNLAWRPDQLKLEPIGPPPTRMSEYDFEVVYLCAHNKGRGLTVWSTTLSRWYILNDCVHAKACTRARWNELVANLLPDSKTPGQQMVPTTASNK